LLLGLASIALLGLLGPAPARALTISPNPFVVPPNEFDPASASIELVGVVSGVPAGGSVLFGSVDPGDVTLLFRADVTSGTSSALALAIQPISSPGSFIPLAGAGWIAGANVDVASSGSAVPGSVYFGPGAPVQAGLSYDVAPAQDGSLEVFAGIQLAPIGFGTATIVPEPGTSLLLAGGLALLAGGRRATRRVFSL
jgi:hypothetical protein